MKVVKVETTYSVQMAVIAVSEGKVLVNQSSLEVLYSGKAADNDTSNPWMITYELMSEILAGQGYRHWETDED